MVAVWGISPVWRMIIAEALWPAVERRVPNDVALLGASTWESKGASDDAQSSWLAISILSFDCLLSFEEARVRSLYSEFHTSSQVFKFSRRFALSLSKDLDGLSPKGRRQEFRKDQ